MCLVTLAYQQHSAYKLILVANRDEFYDRPTAPATFWDDCPDVLAGRDLVAGGTWLGVTRTGRFAALTNYRDPSLVADNRRSRGHVVSDYLCSQLTPAEYTALLSRSAKDFNGFNVIVGDNNSLWYYSNITNNPRLLSAGIYGLSNHLLDTPWPKVKRSKEKMAHCLQAGAIDTDDLFSVLSDVAPACDSELPCTGVGLEWERILSPVFITSEIYGTRSSAVLAIDLSGKIRFTERTYLPETGEYRKNAYSIPDK